MDVTASRAYAAFIAATVVWALLLLLAPFLTSRSHASMLGTGLIVAAYAIGSVVCHQLPERSFHLWTAQLPVCARCTGIYFGAAVMAVAARELRRGSPMRRRREGGVLRRLARRRLSFDTAARRVLALALAPTAVTLAFEWATGHTPANWIRFAAGIPIGAAVAWLVRSAAENQVN